MIDYSILINNINLLFKNNSSFNESWGSISIKGNKYDKLLDDFNLNTTYLKSVGCDSFFKINLDGNLVSKEDIPDYIVHSSEWEISINKSGLIQTSQDTFNNSFFLSSNSLSQWIKNFNPFDKENPFNKFTPLRIFVADIDAPVFSSTIEFVPINNLTPLNVTRKYNLPSSEKIIESIHILSEKEVIINPANFVLLDGNIDSDISIAIRKQAILSLTGSLVSEFFNESKITIDGFRRITIELTDQTINYNIEFLINLCEVVEWVYQEKTSTRKKLLLERLSVDLNEKESFTKSLVKHLASSFIQAKSRYDFVILDRKDLYLKELKDLLKDIKIQSDLYSSKIRSLLSNLLRDSLAAILLVGFTVFTKFSDNIMLDKLKLLDFVFNGLAIYYIISIVYQSVIDVIDIHVSKKELLYWKETARELLPETEFKKHIKDSLKGRKNSLYFAYPLIIISYLAISLSCYKFPSYFKKIEQNPTDTNIKKSLDSVQKDSLKLKINK